MSVMNNLLLMENLNEELMKKMMKDFKGESLGWILVGEKRCFLPISYKELSSFYYNFEVKPDDTWIVTFPRSGTTWTQEMIWLLSNNLDFEYAKSTPLVQRFPFLEISMAINEGARKNLLKENQDSLETKMVVTNVGLSHEIAQSMPSPRFIKTHFFLSLVPNILKSGCKTVYVARNPKDVAVSYYHFHKTVKSYDFQGSFEEFWNYFQNDLSMSLCFNTEDTFCVTLKRSFNSDFVIKASWSPYWEHLKEAWAQRHNPNFLFLFYEEMIYDLLASIKKVSKFLNKTYTDEQYKELADHLQFTNIKNNKMVNLSRDSTKVLFKNDDYIREGKSQAWHSAFTPDLNAKADRWIEDNLRDTDLKFPFINIYS